MPDQPHPAWGFWPAQHAALAIANAAAVQQAQLNYSTVVATQAAEAASTRATLMAAAKAHIDAAMANPVVAANADAVAHLAAAEQILATLT